MSYFILGGLAIYLLVYFRTKYLRARNIDIEKTVRERTNEIRVLKSNVEKLSKIGRDINSSLSIENIIKTVYYNANTLMDAAVSRSGCTNRKVIHSDFRQPLKREKYFLPFPSRSPMQTGWLFGVSKTGRKW